MVRDPALSTIKLIVGVCGILRSKGHSVSDVTQSARITRWNQQGTGAWGIIHMAVLTAQLDAATVDREAFSKTATLLTRIWRGCHSIDDAVPFGNGVYTSIGPLCQIG